MKTTHLAAALLAAAAIPGMAAAQDTGGCLRSNQNSNTEGTLLGAAGGALAGSALAGRHDRGLGAVLGALGGGVIGNRVANSRNDPCPQGYYRDPHYQPAYVPAQPAYGEQGGYQRGDRHDGAYGQGWGRDHSVAERIDFMRDRLSDNQADGTLSPYQARSAERQLDDIARMNRRLAYRDGGQLSGRDENYLQGRLDTLRQRLRWERQGG